VAQSFAGAAARLFTAAGWAAAGEIVGEALTDPAAAEARARAFLDGGGDVFAAFAGTWTGLWHSVGFDEPWQARAGERYDHRWSPTLRAGALELQPVVMGLHDPDAPEGTFAPVHQTEALNAVERASGRLLGAVGIDAATGRAARPHVGYFIEATTLVWVAREGAGALYSCFYEQREAPARYAIAGVQLVWDDATRRATPARRMRGAYLSI
jgi:hypothetical protein